MAMPKPGKAVRGRAVKLPKAPGTVRRQGPSAMAQARANPNASFKRTAPKGGLDIGKFASEVSRNYAKGVATVGKEVDKVGKGVGKAVGDAQRFVSGGGVTGRNTGIRNAMKTGADKSNPLHRILRGPKR